MVCLKFICSVNKILFSSHYCVDELDNLMPVKKKVKANVSSYTP
jgi:hypothetical protein